jgi:hypothetical protein
MDEVNHIQNYCQVPDSTPARCPKTALPKPLLGKGFRAIFFSKPPARSKPAKIAGSSTIVQKLVRAPLFGPLNLAISAKVWYRGCILLLQNRTASPALRSILLQTWTSP